MKLHMMIWALCIGACGCVAPAALAGQVFDYSFSDGTVSAIGTLTANPNGNGSFTAFAGTGSVTGGPNTGILTFIANPNAPQLSHYAASGNHTYDDQLLPGSSSSLTEGGVLFTFQNGDYFNIFSNTPSAGYTALEVTPSGSTSYRGSADGVFTLTAVPEPSSFAMIGIAAMCLAVVAPRRLLRARA
jgi:hypothetical protein